MFNPSDQILHDIARDGTAGALRENLTTMAASVEEDAFVKLVAREIVERTRPQQAIPEVYGHYRWVVRDGIDFFLSQISSGTFWVTILLGFIFCMAGSKIALWRKKKMGIS